MERGWGRRGRCQRKLRTWLNAEGNEAVAEGCVSGGGPRGGWAVQRRLVESAEVT